MSDTPSRKELQKRWERSQEKRKADGRPKALLSFNVPTTAGPKLIEYLMLLSSVWRDKRFGDCISAFLEHGIVEPGTHRFTNAQSPEMDRYNQQQDVECLAQVRQRVRAGKSKNRACEEVAANHGFGNSFDAAVKRLKDLLEQSKKGQPRQVA